jgi:hypothetical protein
VLTWWREKVLHLSILKNPHQNMAQKRMKASGGSDAVQETTEARRERAGYARAQK